MKEITEQQALQKLTALCSRSEHCSWEMTEKMRQWGISPEAQARIMQILTEERFVDDTRYCRAFVKDKIRYNRWGRRKVEQGLFAKRIDSSTARIILDEVDDEEYLNALRPLLKDKRRQLRNMNSYEANGRLIRFAMSRGFTMDIIRQCIDTDEDYDSGNDYD